MDIRHNWTKEEALQLLNFSLSALCEKANTIHKKYAHQDVQKCVLLSVKTGGCPEDCGYCSQSAHSDTKINIESLMDPLAVYEKAKSAKEMGATRFCMGAAWRDVPTDHRFDKVLEMIRCVSKLNLEVCCTMGMATEDQLKKMKEAGLTAFNHNIDTGPDYYSKVVTTHTFEERLNTLRNVRKSGVQICSGGILGLGEEVADRASMLCELATLNPHPESVPINILVPIKATPFEKNDAVPFEDFLRVLATARIMMPQSRIRLSAGRNKLSQEEQLKCFSVGANSIFMGDKLLTTTNVAIEKDKALLDKAGNSLLSQF